MLSACQKTVKTHAKEKNYQFSKRLQRSNDIQKNFREDSRNLEFQDIFV